MTYNNLDKNRCKIGSQDFRCIFTWASNLSTLVFDDCLFTDSKYDIQVQENDFKIKLLSFQSCGNQNNGNWENSVDKLKIILSALDNVQLCNKLKTVNFSDCGMASEDDIQNAMDEIDFTKTFEIDILSRVE